MAASKAHPQDVFLRSFLNISPRCFTLMVIPRIISGYIVAVIAIISTELVGIAFVSVVFSPAKEGRLFWVIFEPLQPIVVVPKFTFDPSVASLTEIPIFAVPIAEDEELVREALGTFFSRIRLLGRRRGERSRSAEQNFTRTRAFATHYSLFIF